MNYKMKALEDLQRMLDEARESIQSQDDCSECGCKEDSSEIKIRFFVDSMKARYEVSELAEMIQAIRLIKFFQTHYDLNLREVCAGLCGLIEVKTKQNIYKNIFEDKE